MILSDSSFRVMNVIGDLVNIKFYYLRFVHFSDLFCVRKKREKGEFATKLGSCLWPDNIA